MLSSGCRNSHRCLSERHHASINEFEKLTSICAMTRCRALPSKSGSTSPLRFSTPESMNTAASVGAARLPAALVSTSCVFIGSRRPATVQARTFREKLSMTACTYAFVPSSNRMIVTSMCQASFGAVVRSPTFGLAGYSRSLGRPQPRSRISLPHVAGCANTLPMRWAWSARPRMDMWRCSVDWTMPPIASTSPYVSRCGLERGQLGRSSSVQTSSARTQPWYRADDSRSTRRAADSGMARRARSIAPSKRLFSGRIGDSRQFEGEAGDSQQGEHEPQDRGQHRHPPLQLGDALLRGGLATVCLDERDDLPDPTADPAHRRGAGDLQFREELRIPCADDLLLDSVVVGAARAMAHGAIRPWSSRPIWSTKPSRKRRAMSRSASASRRLHNVRRLSRASATPSRHCPRSWSGGPRIVRESSEMSEVRGMISGATGDRTPDLCIANAALSQLSYCPGCGPRKIRRRPLKSSIPLAPVPRHRRLGEEPPAIDCDEKEHLERQAQGRLGGIPAARITAPQARP